MKRISLIIATLIMGLLLQQTSWAETKKVSGAAPDFKLTTLDGKKLKLSDYKGKVLVVSFWASWCIPCEKEIPQLEKLYSTYHKAGVEVIGVSRDHSEANARAFINKQPVSFPVAMDVSDKVTHAFNEVTRSSHSAKNQPMPSTYFINPKGEVAYVHLGYKPGDEKNYKKLILKLMAM